MGTVARRRWVTVLEIVCLLFVSCCIVVFIVKNFKVIAGSASNSLIDFNWYYYAFHVSWRGLPSSTLYNISAQRLELHNLGVSLKDPLSFFGYPPQFAVLLSPVAILGLVRAKILWTVLNSALYLVALILLTNSIYRGSNLFVRLTLIGIGLLNSPLYSDILLGQVNRLLFFLISLSVFMLSKETRWRILAGVFLGLAVMIKVIPIVILLFLLLRREWKVIISFVSTVVLATACTAWHLGTTVLTKYAFTYLPYFNHLNMEHGAAPWNNSFIGVMELFLNSTVASRWDIFFRILVILIGLIVVLTSSYNLTTDISVSVMVMLLLSPVVEVHYLTLAIISELVIAAHLVERVELRTRVEGKVSIREVLQEHGLKGFLLLSAFVILLFHSHSPSYFLAMIILFFLSCTTPTCSIRKTYLLYKTGLQQLIAQYLQHSRQV